MVLVKDAGYTLSDIRGEQRMEREVVPCSPAEQFLGSLRPSTAKTIGGAAVGFGLVTSLLSGQTAPLIAGLLCLGLLWGLSQFEPEPETIERSVRTEGMTVDEVMGRLVQHDEHEQMKNEEAEAQARKAKREGGS